MIHVAVLLKPYLDLIISGRKTIECRLTRDARDPYEMIEAGERIYFKQSAGPYGATAIAEHVICEGNLSPRRILELRRDYNDLICGETPFWNYKRNARFCTLIWLTDVTPTQTGPAIRPLQGVAWLTLEEEPAWRRVDKGAASLFPGPSFFVTVTPGNLRNNSLYITAVRDRFPAWTVGGKSKAEAAKPMTLILHEGPTVQTDIVGLRGMLRSRVWGTWFRSHGVKPGDRVVFTPINDGTYFVGLSRQK